MLYVQERDALRAELEDATGQITSLQEAVQVARQAEQQGLLWREQAQANFGRVNAQLRTAVQAST